LEPSEERMVTRHGFIRLGAILGLGPVAASALAACGGGGSSAENAGGEAADLQKKLDDASKEAEKASGPVQVPAPASAGTKHVKVVVSSNIPADVSITDDNFDWVQQSEITGDKTYEHDIASDSGLLAEASNLDQEGQIYVGVYENGKLVAEDSDPQYAQVAY
jgi:hypothetical protein